MSNWRRYEACGTCGGEWCFERATEPAVIGETLRVVHRDPMGRGYCAQQTVTAELLWCANAVDLVRKVLERVTEQVAREVSCLEFASPQSRV